MSLFPKKWSIPLNQEQNTTVLFGAFFCCSTLTTKTGETVSKM